MNESTLQEAKKYFDIIKDPDHLDRFRSYDFRNNLYYGEFYKIFEINDYEYFESEYDYISANFAALMTDTITDLMWIERPTITFVDDNNAALFDTLNQESDFFLKMRQVSETNSAQGDAVVRLVTHGVNQLHVDLISPDIWYPIYNKDNPNRKAEGHILKYSKKKESEDFTAVLLEVHHTNKIQHFAARERLKDKNVMYEIVSVDRDWGEGMAQVANTALEKEKPTPTINNKTKFGTCFHFPNIKKCNVFFGVSDYTVSLIAKIKAINLLLNQAQHVIKQHADPKMVVSRTLINKTIEEMRANNEVAKNYGYKDTQEVENIFSSKLGSVQRTREDTRLASLIVKKMNFMEKGEAEDDPHYLTWDGKLEESHKQIERIINLIMQEAKLSPVLYNPDVSIGSLSGVAIKRLAQPSLNKAKNKIDYIKSVMGPMIHSSLVLMGSKNPEIPTIEFQDGLVDDVAETITNVSAQISAGIMTQVQAIMQVQKITLEKAKQVKIEIDEENGAGYGDPVGGGELINSVNTNE
jgi:hypothetical protein